jgi:hypothetical protein
MEPKYLPNDLSAALETKVPPHEFQTIALTVFSFFVFGENT